VGIIVVSIIVVVLVLIVMYMCNRRKRGQMNAMNAATGETLTFENPMFPSTLASSDVTNPMYAANLESDYQGYSEFDHFETTPIPRQSGDYVDNGDDDDIIKHGRDSEA
jgi:hypothetical protein